MAEKVCGEKNKRDRDWGAGKGSDSRAQSCLSQQKPRGHVGCSRSSMSRSTESGLVACRMG